MKNLNSITLKNCEELISLTLRTRNSRRTVVPAMPCQISKNNQNCGNGDNSHKVISKLAWILEATESTRPRMGESSPNRHEDHTAGKGDNSLQHCNLVHKFIPMPRAMKIPAPKAALDKEWEKWERFRRGTWRKSEVNQRWSMKQGRRAQEFILPHWWTYVIWKMPNWRQKHQKYKGRVVLRGDIVKNDFGSYAVFTEQGSSASQMTAGKVMDIIARLPGCDGQAADAVSAYTQVKMEDAHKIFQNPKSECPDIWIRLPRHKWPKSWSSMEDPVVLLSVICTVILWQDCYGKGNLRKSYSNIDGRKFQIVNVSSYTVKRVILICVCGWHQVGWKDTNYYSDVESTQQRSWFGRANIILWSCILGMYSKTVWNKQRYCWQLQNHVWITNFRKRNWKTTMIGKCSYFFVVLRYGGSCQEFCWTILWVGKQDDSTTLQSIYSMHRWPSFQRRRIEISKRMSNVCFQIVLKF